MRILFINETCGVGSHGRICAELAQKYESAGDTCYIAYGRFAEVPEDCRRFAKRIGTVWDLRLHGALTRIFDCHGFGSRHATSEFLKWADEYDPELVWLHNIHGYYINIELLFRWLKSRPQMTIKWTLHDCWAFTGHCAHYTFAKCERWKTGCFDCPEKRSYPSSYLFDNSRINYIKKKGLFTGVQNMSLIVPCRWLEEQVKQSFLSEYHISVVNNKIDQKIFRPSHGDVLEKYHIKGKIILGVSNTWAERKGFNDFIRLSELLGEQYQLVLVGVTDQQMKKLPGRMIGIKKTENKRELSELYTAADYFVNLTYEDTYPTVNLEAEACGTDVITYDAGGSRETIKRKNSAYVPVGDLESVVKIIEKEKRENSF